MMTYADTIAITAAALAKARRKTAPLSWRELARPSQLPPDEWRTWYVRGGRGSGKTWTGANILAEMARAEPGEYGVVAPTFEAVRTVCFEGPRSGLIRAFGTNLGDIKRGASQLVESYNLSTAILRLRNGSIIYGDGADDGAPTIQGKNLRGLWADEVGLWRRWQQAWNESIRYAVRLAPARIVATGTPKAGHPLVRSLMSDDSVHKSLLRTIDNVANLDADFIAELYEKYGGTQLGRQELGGELIEEMEGALWRHSYFEYNQPPDLVRIVVGIDPAVTSGEASDETGIIAAGKGADRKGYVLADASGRYTPDGWARRAVELADEMRAEAIIVETNNGGDMCKLVLENELERRRNVGAPVSVAVRGVTASRGKRTRAEPISQLYEQHRVIHVGPLPTLEDQCCTWVPDEGESPDRLDALVWALTELMLGEPGILGLYRAVLAGRAVA
jgi:predicted phage terminase large subunit-like protein